VVLGEVAAFQLPKGLLNFRIADKPGVDRVGQRKRHPRYPSISKPQTIRKMRILSANEVAIRSTKSLKISGDEKRQE